MKRMIYFVLALYLMMTGFAINGDERFQLVKTIGDDRDNYTIFGLADALLAENNDIYILNARANYVAHYNWNGKYIRKIGQKGAGPGDFYFPRSLAYFDKKLYIMDSGNHRVVEMNLETDKFQVYKEKESNRLGSSLSVLNEGTFLGVFKFIRENRGRIGIVDKDFNIIKSFFDQYPVDVEVEKADLTELKSMERIARKVLSSSHLHPIYALSSNKKEILVSFRSPDNPVVFFVYNLDGKLLRKFSHIISEKKYKFPLFFLTASIEELRNPNKWPDRYSPRLDSVFIYKNHYIAFLSLHDYVKKELVNNRSFCLIFNREGILKHRFPLKRGLRIFDMCSGYFLGTVNDEDIEKLYIYTLNL